MITGDIYIKVFTLIYELYKNKLNSTQFSIIGTFHLLEDEFKDIGISLSDYLLIIDVLIEDEALTIYAGNSEDLIKSTTVIPSIRLTSLSNSLYKAINQ